MLKSERLQYVPLDITHAQGLYRLWSNPLVVKYMMCPQKSSIQECKEWINKLLTDLKEPNVFTVFFNHNIIGMGGTPCWNKDEGSYGLYYQLSEDYWGAGYGFEIAKTLSKYAFVNCNAEKILTYAVTENKGSNHILQKLGMRIVETRDGGFAKGDISYDENGYAMTKSEWLAIYDSSNSAIITQ